VHSLGVITATLCTTTHSPYQPLSTSPSELIPRVPVLHYISSQHVLGPPRTQGTRTQSGTQAAWLGLFHSLSGGGSVKALSKITGRNLCWTYHPLVYKVGHLTFDVGNLVAMTGKLFSDTSPNKGAALPRYTSHGAGPSTSTSDNHPAPPPYHLEEVRFPIGGKVPKDSLVTPSQLKTHLGLLGAFRELKTRVTDLEANQDVQNKLPPLARDLGPQERWTWFSELALERCVLSDPCVRLVLLDFGFVGSIAGFRNYLRFASQTAQFITLPWMCGSFGMRIC